jgi:hypothetical protein
MTTLRFTRALAAITVAFPIFCSAAVVNIHQTVDLNTLNLGSGFVLKEYDAPVTLAVGDTVHLTYDFAGDQTLKMYKPFDIFGWLSASDMGCTEFQATGSLQFVNGRGPVRAVSKTETSECLQFGLTFDSSEFTSKSGGMIEFSGLDFVMSIDAYNNRNSRDYTGPLLFLRAGAFDIGREGDAYVPEPASFGLVGLGVAALAAGRRRKAANKADK